jgi:hypothetical protein
VTAVATVIRALAATHPATADVAPLDARTV